MTRKRILILEDDPKSRFALQSILESHGHSVQVFENAEDGQKWDANEIDIAIIDIRLPRQYGTDFARELRVRNPKVRIIFVTAYDGLEKLGAGLDGTTLFIKPIDMDALLKLI